jgi:hypothetical protein
MKKCKKSCKKPTLDIYECIRSKILFNYSRIWTTNAYGDVLINSICKTEKKSKAKKLFNSFLHEKVPKKLAKTHIGYLDASDLRFYSITLKFEPQVHKKFY